MPLKVQPEKRKMPIGRIVSGLSLALAITALVLALKKPQPVAAPQTKAVRAASAESFQTKLGQLEQAQAQGLGGTEVRLSADEIRAAFTQAITTPQPQTSTSSEPSGESSALESMSIDDLNVGEPIVSFEGDQVKGQFASDLGGKKVYITLNGHLGAKDGYATFEPTEFKIGDLSVPVSLVNDAFQKRLMEQRDRLKLPDYVSDIRVENGELVIKQR